MAEISIEIEDVSNNDPRLKDINWTVTLRPGGGLTMVVGEHFIHAPKDADLEVPEQLALSVAVAMLNVLGYSSLQAAQMLYPLLNDPRRKASRN